MFIVPPRVTDALPIRPPVGLTLKEGVASIEFVTQPAQLRPLEVTFVSPEPLPEKLPVKLLLALLRFKAFE
jgi:hypothetical protein